MSEGNQLINKLEHGVDALIEKVSGLNVTVKNQQVEIIELKQLSESFKVENSVLNEKVKNLKAEVEKSSSDDVGQYKTRISELVNEIDSCISLLNG